MNMNETLTLIAYMLAPAFFSLLGLAAYGCPGVATLGEVAAKAKKRVFYDKYGQQTASLGIILIISTIVVCCAGILVVFTKFPQFIPQMTTVPPLFRILFGMLACFVVLGLTHALTWKKMRSNKGLHLFMGMLATIAGITTIVLAVSIKLLIGWGTPSSPDALQQIQALIAPTAIMYVFFALAAAAGLSCTYLIFRRHKDDFGRDYYNFALKLSSNLALLFMACFLACQGWLFTQLPETFKTIILGTPLGLVWGGAAGLGFICALLWLLIWRSTTPLQFKGLSIVATTLLWLMHTLNATFFVNLMTMI